MKLKSFVLFLSMSVLIFSTSAPAAPSQTKTPKISVNPMSANFGSVKVSSTSARAITVKNTGTSDLAISNINITGPNASEFSQTSDCATVPPQGSCTITGTFALTSMGSKTATLSISSNDPKNPALDVKLSGNATSPAPGTIEALFDDVMVESGILPGDSNGDGRTTIDEVQRCINQFLGISSVEPCNDLNGDGRVTIDEVQKVINAFLGLGFLPGVWDTSTWDNCTWGE